ncbi:MAG: heme A synthase [Longimicrobiales bacterium]|nr:heme A synthase [Longimicrobiales bacterium]
MSTFVVMERPLHNRAFRVSVVWTLVLLFLGSVVHATESSLACPDWPTCYGSMVPEMTGGVFWEHLHRLVAGGLILMWTLALYLVWRPADERPWLRKATLGGLVLLLIQAVLGGITVILLLPDPVSTSHLGLAFAFLALATVLGVSTSPGWGHRKEAVGTRGEADSIRPWAIGAAVLVFAQSLLGAWVRHAEAGLACPQIPLCLGEWVPPLDQPLIAIHFFHRAAGIFVGILVLGVAWMVRRRTTDERMRKAATAAVILVVAQIALGFFSVTSFLAVTPVSLHTLVAATLLAVLTAMATWTWEPADRKAMPTPDPTHREGGQAEVTRTGDRAVRTQE